MTGLMTQVVTKAQGLLRKPKAVLQLAAKRDINEILRLYYEEGWIDRGRPDLEFLLDSSPNSCFKFTVNGEIVGVTFATAAGDGIYYPNGNLIGAKFRGTVNYFNEGIKYNEYLKRVAKVEVIFATRSAIPLYRELEYEAICDYRGALVDTSGAARQPARARLATESDLPSVFAYSRRVYRVDRERLIRHFLDRGLTRVFVIRAQTGDVEAYAMVRKHLKGESYLLGPVVAEDPHSAADVVAAAAQVYPGQILSIEASAKQVESLLACGVCRAWDDTYTLKMFRGDRNLLEDEGRIYGIFSRYIS